MGENPAKFPLHPLGDPSWVRAGPDRMDEYPPELWHALNRQRDALLPALRPKAVLALFELLGDEPSFGYPMNMQGHALQSATLALRDGRDEETVAVALLHDIGFTLARDSHGDFAALVLGPYISEANRWMLRHHPVFADYHTIGVPGIDRDGRDRWRGHPHFAWTAEFVDRYDQQAVSRRHEILPLDAFRPLVFRLFARTPDFSFLKRAA